MKRLLNWFFQGLILLGPLAVTVYVSRVLFWTVDGWLGLPIPGSGFVVTVLLITLVGFLASFFITRTILVWIERLLAKLPFVRLVYASTKDLLSAFVGEKRRFDKAVLVKLWPGGNAQALGFVTQESLASLGLPGHVSVYFPMSYNFAGYTLVFPSDQVQPIAANSADVMAFIVSGGITALPSAP